MVFKSQYVQKNDGALEEQRSLDKWQLTKFDRNMNLNEIGMATTSSVLNVPLMCQVLPRQPT